MIDYSAISHQREFASGNIYIRTSGSPLTKGAVVKAHAHNFDHTSFVMSGSVRVKKDGAEQICAAPAWLLIEAGVEHEIEALEDGTVFWCVFAHRNQQGDVVQEFTGWHEATQ